MTRSIFFILLCSIVFAGCQNSNLSAPCNPKEQSPILAALTDLLSKSLDWPVDLEINVFPGRLLPQPVKSMWGWIRMDRWLWSGEKEELFDCSIATTMVCTIRSIQLLFQADIWNSPRYQEIDFCANYFRWAPLCVWGIYFLSTIPKLYLKTWIFYP